MVSRRSLRVVPIVCGLAAVLVVLVTGPGRAGEAPRPSSAPAIDPAQACRAPAGKTVRISFAVEGDGRRSALVHLPRGRRGAVPLILALHGAYGSGAFMERYSGLSRLADRYGFAVVYPDSVGTRWRIAATDTDADVRFLDGVLDRLLAGGCADEDRVSAVGVSNGGGMAARFACAGEDRLAGLVSVAGGYGSLPQCQARAPLSVLEIHGTADSVVPYYGRPNDPGGSVLRWLGRWIDRDSCGRSPSRSESPARVQRLSWSSCRDGTEVRHLRLLGGAHAWPGADPPDPGPSFGISAAEEAWEFLRGRRRASAVAKDHEG
jgi:polyhydroxybutyrate depolymerase